MGCRKLDEFIGDLYEEINIRCVIKLKRVNLGLFFWNCEEMKVNYY